MFGKQSMSLDHALKQPPEIGELFEFEVMNR